MAKDYKHRAEGRSSPRKRSAKQPAALWKWGIVAVLIFLFVYFLYFLRHTDTQPGVQPVEILPEAKEAQPVDKTEPPGAEEPRFGFYTMLPEKEVIIPEREIKTRKREESLGRAAKESYTLQIGSFKHYAEADRLKAQLALLGVEAKIETAKIGDTVWNRVKIGPFNSMTRLDRVRSRLRQHHIDSIVQTAR